MCFRNLTASISRHIATFPKPTGSTKFPTTSCVEPILSSSADTSAKHFAHLATVFGAFGFFAYSTRSLVQDSRTVILEIIDPSVVGFMMSPLHLRGTVEGCG